ncbi:LacI family DNA-binding transcriptional regulator [Paenibacillus sp. GCM10027626]|uniref:LacI family DNA-binding transcriptional regulator n=1 Tax=Paenibacillus sp. GCM10027626 TaxID=3273411 RepID=UPI00362B86D5
MKKISMQYIADRLGVSKYTVSQALAGKEGVSEATRLKVTALAQALGYQVRSAAGADEAGASERVVLVGMEARHIAEPLFWAHVKEGIEAGCRTAAMHPVFFTFHAGKSADWLQRLLHSEECAAAAGFIIAGNCPTDALLRLSHTGKPIVLADHEEAIIAADCVLNANVDAGRMACHHLLAHGCRSLAFVGRDHYAVSFRERWWGCRMALDDRNGKQAVLKYGSRYSQVPEEVLAAGAQLRKWTISYGTSAWQQPLRKKIELESERLPDGFICANDDIALELLAALNEKGVNVPGQTKVVGIDNTASAGQARLPLTSVDLGKERLGLRAVEALSRRLARPGEPAEKIILPANLVVRATG